MAAVNGVQMFISLSAGSVVRAGLAGFFYFSDCRGVARGKENMNRLQAMQIFVAIADEKSFSRAAAIVGLARSSVTAIVQRLEDYLGVALIERTTRKLALTEQGLMYYQVCKQVLHALDRGERSLRLSEISPQDSSLRDTGDVQFSKAVSFEEAAFILSPEANAERFFGLDDFHSDDRKSFTPDSSPRRRA